MHAMCHRYTCIAWAHVPPCVCVCVCVCVCEMRVNRVYEKNIPQINLSSPNRQRKWKECVHRPVSVR
jgi:hypothetical protein